MAAQAGPRQQYNQFNSLPNGAPQGGPPSAPTGVPTPGARPLEPNQGRIVQAGSARVLCVADVRGDLESLNTLAKEARADYVIHTGDFGFYDERSLERVADKTLKHVVQYSPLIEETTRRQIQQLPGSTSIKNTVPHQHLQLSQLPQFLNGQRKFNVPIYAVWGACEDVQVLEKLRAQEYKIENLHILDEAHSRLLDVGGVKLRLLGLGGAVVMHKLFDNGEGRTTIAGGQGTMWTTLLQIGELIDTANRTFDPTETRLLVTHASPAREGLLNQLAVALKADFSVSGGLHFRYGSSYNEFSVNPSMDHFRGKLAASRASFQDVWDTVRSEVEPIVAENEAHQKLLTNALEVVMKMPAVANGGNPFGGQAGGSAGQIDEAAFKNMWNFNLADAAFGYLVLEIEGGRIGTEMRALGFNFSHRGAKTVQQAQEVARATTTLPTTATPSLAPPSFQQTAQPVVSTPSAPSAPTAPQSSMQTRPGQQPRAPSQQQPPQNRNQPPQPAPSNQPAQSQPPKAPTPSSRPTTQQPANQAVKQSAPTAPTTNGTPATSDSKPNGVASPAPADAATTSTPPPPKPEPSTGIFLANGPKSEDEVKDLFTDSEHRSKITGIEPQGNKNYNGWQIKFSTNDEMRKALASLPTDMTARDYPHGAMHAKPFHSNPRGGFGNRGPSMGGYKSGSDTEGGRGGRGGFGRGRGGRGDGRGGRGGRGRGGSERGGQAGQSTASPAPAAATGGGSGDKAS